MLPERFATDVSRIRVTTSVCSLVTEMYSSTQLVAIGAEATEPRETYRFIVDIRRQSQKCSDNRSVVDTFNGRRYSIYALLVTDELKIQSSARLMDI